MSDYEVKKRSSVLFVSVAAAGQFNSLLAIAEAFKTLHPDVDVAFATSPEVRNRVLELGLTYVEAWSFSSMTPDMISRFNAGGIRSVGVVDQYTRWVRSESMYDAPKRMLSAWIRQQRPLLVVSDVVSEAGMAAALDTDTPYIINSPTPPYVSFPEALPRLYPPLGSGVSRFKHSLWQRLYDFFAVATYGLGLVRRVVPFLEEQKQLKSLATPSELAQHSRFVLNDSSPLVADPRVRWPADKVRWIGASLCRDNASLRWPEHFEAKWQATRAQAQYSALAEWLDASERPVLLVALGTIYQLDEERVQTLYHALSSLDIDVLWKLPAREQRFLPRMSPRMHVVQWLPSLPLLLAHPKVKAFLNHAGANSLHEGLFFGKPQICMPAWLDCFDFAMQLQDCGAGLSVMTAPRLDEQEIAEAVSAVIFGERKGAFRQKAEAIGDDLVRLGGARQAAELIGQELGVAGGQRGADAL